MPPKSRQASQKQTGASNASGAGLQVPTKSKAGAQQQSTESNPAQWPDANAFLPPTLASLRRDWRWAGVSQFLYTFQGPLRIDPYVEVELEEDLAYGSDFALSKIVHRLLFTLAQDRKITPQNWMGYLQGQYARRYSPRPNPFLQDMLPLSLSPDEEKPTETIKLENDVKQALEEDFDPDAPGASVDKKPNDSSALGDDDSQNKPNPENMTRQEATDVLEANESVATDPPPPEPAVKRQPMRQWLDLSQSEQLDVLWTLCEWQFTGAMRLRTLLGDDDLGVGWRMEPVGWDSKKNAYWLVGENRLWIQHHIPQPPKPSKKRGRTQQATVMPIESNISSRVPPSFSDNEYDGEGTNGVQPENTDQEEPEAEPASSRSSTPPPAIQSKKSLARQSRSSTAAGKRRTNESANESRKRPKVTGTRVSQRLRGSGKKDADEDGWQSVPDEWLDKDDEPKQSPKTDDPFGSDSDLTEVEELEREIEQERKKREETQGGQRRSGRTRRKGKDKGSEVPKVPKPEPEPEPVKEEPLDVEDSKSKQFPIRLHMAPLVDPMLPPPLPPGFIEWETVCASLQDWEAFPARFEKATHPNEKSFRSYLNKILVPAVTTSLKAQLKVKKLETAVQNRKRSSRLAIKESIVEAQRQEDEKRAADLELHARARRQEERQRRQEEDMLKREREREERVRSREARAERRIGWDGSESGSASPAPTPEVSSDPPVKIRLRTGRVPSTTPTSSPVETPISSTPPSAPGSGTTSRADDSWELLCEGCGKQSWNTDDGSQLVRCESCGRWSHTTCHDRADVLAGNPKREWSSVEFTCRACSNTARKAGVNGVVPPPKTSNGTVSPAIAHSASHTNGSHAAIPPVQTAPIPAAYMYGAFQAAPNGHIPAQPVYPPHMPLHTYAPPGQPRTAQPAPNGYVPYAQVQPAPIPQFQTPVPPLSQPSSMYPHPYLNGHSGPRERF
ncbi:hypothetical protein RSOLAG1IB_01352 [Rhizoctonia solani AG-1 IB]|uniref:PHD-type domain-containing protein n=1 Tax=Thanatephorus cucumeris (strain AG1-IB / isolate 7/3/14) TaxID=1108050 RepID=A0A0B7FGK4_THACB|nr:hypothetical protein RSOLAG1IB_01352 [Rhizoctonia solani AG-1 IB]